VPEDALAYERFLASRTTATEPTEAQQRSQWSAQDLERLIEVQNISFEEPSAAVTAENHRQYTD
jgi:hypothetical protein